MTALRTPFKPGFGDDEAAELAAVLKALIDPSRLKILALLHTHGEMSVTALEGYLPLQQPSVSHHLRILGAAGLVHARPEGAHRYRSLNTARVRELSRLLDPGWSK